MEHKPLQTFINKRFLLTRPHQLKSILKQLYAVSNLADEVTNAILILATKHKT